MVAWSENNRKKPRGSRCLAKKRDGTLCQNWAMPNGRCRLHGGKAVPAPKGSKRALKHGLYAKGLLPGEKELYSSVPLGSLDDELRMLKIKLRRAWEAQRMWLEANNEIQNKVSDEEENQVEGFVRRRLTRTIKPVNVNNHYRLDSVESSSTLVHDKDGIAHTNRSVKTIKKKEDYSQEIRALSKLISQLEMRRKELVGDDEDTAKNLVDQFREFADMASETLPGGRM